MPLNHIINQASVLNYIRLDPPSSWRNQDARSDLHRSSVPQWLCPQLFSPWPRQDLKHGALSLGVNLSDYTKNNSIMELLSVPDWWLIAGWLSVIVSWARILNTKKLEGWPVDYVQSWTGPDMKDSHRVPQQEAEKEPLKNTYILPIHNHW